MTCCTTWPGIPVGIEIAGRQNIGPSALPPGSASPSVVYASALDSSRACAKVEPQCAVLNADSVRFSRLAGGQHATFEHPNTRGELEQVLGNWEESDEGSRVDGPLASVHLELSEQKRVGPFLVAAPHLLQD